MTCNSNIAAHLPEIAEKLPDALAVAVQSAPNSAGLHEYAQYTFAELNAESDLIASGLQAMGIEPGMRTVLMVKPSLDFFAITFALFKAGAVPVMVDPGMGIKNLKKCLEEAAPEAFVGITKAHAARVILGWGKKSIRHKVTVGPRLFWGGTTLDKVKALGSSGFNLVESQSEDMAAILFTSGSTGVPKGAVYTHAIFNAQVDALREDYGIEPGERDLATFPLFALFGPALGMAAIVPNMDASKPATANPRDLVSAAQEFDCTNFFASPALINLVGRYGEAEKLKLPKLKRVISAGAPANIAALRAFQKLLPEGVEILPSYGATEALPLTSIGTGELLSDAVVAATANGAGMCVGKPLGQAKLAVIRISDEPIATWSEDLLLPTGTIGEIVARGPIVTREYFRREDATALAKIQDGDEIVHRMGDVGYLDDQGRLWMCGRKAHRVVTATKTLFTIPCERIFDEHPMVRRTALVGVTNGGKTRPILCVELLPEHQKAGRAARKQVEEELLAMAKEHEITRSIEKVLFHDGFPVDVRHNAKISREALAVWAQEKVI